MEVAVVMMSEEAEGLRASAVSTVVVAGTIVV